MFAFPLGASITQNIIHYTHITTTITMMTNNEQLAMTNQGYTTMHQLLLGSVEVALHACLET